MGRRNLPQSLASCMSRPTHSHENYYPDDESLCRLITVYPDMQESYLWQGAVGVGVEMFGGSEDLGRRFAAWSTKWEEAEAIDPKIDPNEPRWLQWEEEGVALSREFRAILSTEYTLWFYGLRREPIEILA